MISILLPSRRRPTALADTIASLRDNATNPDTVQVLVAYDGDDAKTGTIARKAGATAVRFKERHGYSGLHHYVNALAARADGEWLMLFNDDARMLTQGWDGAVHGQAPGVLWPHSNDIPACNTFPVWPREWTSLLGHASLSPHCDSWIQHLGEALDVQRRIPVEILHDRADLTGGHDDQTRAEGLAGYRTAEYHSPEMAAARDRDVAALRAALEMGGAA